MSWPSRAAVVLVVVGALAACGDKDGNTDDDDGYDTSGTDGGSNDGGAGDGGSSDGGSSDGGSSDGGSSDGGSSDGGSSDGGAGDGGSSGPSADEALFRDAVDGAVDARTALRTIADRDGLPVVTESGSFLFGCLCGDGDWKLAGDHEGWVGQAMERSGELSWIEVEIADPADSAYKFTDGDRAWIPDPWSRRYGYDDFGEFSLVRADAAHLERWFQVEGAGLLPRRLRVWVPDDGDFSHALYAHDGNNLFDPDAIWGGWRLQDSLPDDMLVVGIDNTADRMDEYTHVQDVVYGDTYGGLADDYADLVHTVIRPKMDEAYGVADLYGVMGSSLGGLVSYHIADREPELWDMVISMSGTMVWGSIELNNPTMPEIWSGREHRAMVLYLDSGGQGTCYDSDGDGVPDDDPTARDNYCENAWFRDLLAESGYTYDVDLFHWHEPGATHDELAWAERVWRPLDIFASL